MLLTTFGPKVPIAKPEEKKPGTTWPTSQGWPVMCVCVSVLVSVCVCVVKSDVVLLWRCSLRSFDAPSRAQVKVLSPSWPSKCQRVRYISWYPVSGTHYHPDHRYYCSNSPSANTLLNRMVATSNNKSIKNNCPVLVNDKLHHKEDQYKCRFCAYCGRSETDLQKHFTLYHFATAATAAANANA